MNNSGKNSNKRTGWQQAKERQPARAVLTPEAKRRRAEYLRNWSLYVGQLLFAELERR
jgi:hypothetical protein